MEKIVTAAVVCLVLVIAIFGVINFNPSPGQAVRIDAPVLDMPDVRYEQTQLPRDFMPDPNNMRPVLQNNEPISANFNGNSWQMYTDGKTEFWARPAK